MGFQGIEKIEVAPGMIPTGHHIHTRLQQLIEGIDAHPLPVVRILSIADHKINMVAADEAFQHPPDNLQSRSAYNIANKEYPEGFLSHTHTSFLLLFSII